MYLGNQIPTPRRNILDIVHVDNDYTVDFVNDSGKIFVVDTTLGDVNIFLPELIWNNKEIGQVFYIKKSDFSANKVNIIPFGSQTFDSEYTVLVLEEQDDVVGLTSFYSTSSGQETWLTLSATPVSPQNYQDSTPILNSIESLSTTSGEFLVTVAPDTFNTSNILSVGIDLINSPTINSINSYLEIKSAAFETSSTVPVLDSNNAFSVRQILPDGNTGNIALSFIGDTTTGVYIDNTNLIMKSNGVIALSLTDSNESTAQDRLNISSGSGKGKTSFTGSQDGNGNDAGFDSVSSLYLGTNLNGYHIFSSNMPSVFSRIGTDGSVIDFYHGDSFFSGSINVDDSGTYYTTVSDYRLKKNIQPINNSIEILESLNPVYFNWKTDENKTVAGFLAHELQEVLPELVNGNKDGKMFQTIDQTKIIPVLVASYQELVTKFKYLKNEYNGLL